jgi:hypothetical protein
MPYLGLPATLRDECLGLHVLLEEWSLRDLVFDKEAPRRFGTEALRRMDKMIGALTEAREQLAEEMDER